MTQMTPNTQLLDPIALDDRLSQRPIDLDPSGYFIIYLDRAAALICAEHYTNTINDQGLACDPETGEPLACKGSLPRQPTVIIRGRTAKEVCVELFEKEHAGLVSRLDHAAYLGRELLRAEIALLSGQDYVQD